MFPQIAIVAPLYMLASKFGWLDTYRILIVVYLALRSATSSLGLLRLLPIDSTDDR